MTERYHRNELLFGREGQNRLAESSVAVVGVGGLGSHVVQQLSYLGVGSLVLVDADSVEESNLNRLVGGRPEDVGTPKVDAVAKHARAVRPDIRIVPVASRVEDERARTEVARVDVVFGCLDRDLPRLALTDAASSHGQPYFDLATDSGDDGSPWYGGRIVIARGDGCLSCLNLLDQEEMRRDVLTPDQRAAHDQVYGMDAIALERPGPAIVSVNGVVASLGVTLFIEFCVGLQEPPRHLIYRGERRTLLRSIDEPTPDCFYCDRWRQAKGSG